MKRYLSLIFLYLVLFNNAFASGVPSVFDLRTCIADGTYANLKVDTVTRRVAYDFDNKNDADAKGTFFIKNISNDGIILTDGLIYKTLLEGNRGKWWNLSLKNTLTYLKIDTKNKSFTQYIEVLNTSEKKIIKSFKKTWGATSGIVGKQTFNCQTYYAYNEPKKQQPKKQKPKTISPDDEKVVPAGSGSGFFVSREGHIITNHHVVDSCNIIKVSFKGNQIDAKILAVDKMNDIAILKTNIKPNRVFPISNEDVSLLEDVVVAGYPLGKQVSSAIKTHKGVVTALAGAGDNYSNFQTDATINPGNSGGPIMNQKGNIVGIAVQTWIEDGIQGIHFGIKSSTLKTFANSNKLSFEQPNYRELSNKDLGKLITEATVYVECHMTIAKIKKMIAQSDNKKAFFSEYR